MDGGNLLFLNTEVNEEEDLPARWNVMDRYKVYQLRDARSMRRGIADA